MSAAICAFDRCQAGGVILPGAPRMVELVGTFTAEATWVEGLREHHPGCWDAEQRRAAK